MVFGDPQRFAIEFQLNEDYGGPWLFGKVCYWICGHRVGDDLGTTLRDVLWGWERILCDANTRTNEILMTLDTESLVKTLSRGLYGNAGENEPFFLRGIEEQWARHSIGPEGEVFDHWRIFLVEQSCVGRCVYHRTGSPGYHECCLEYGEFDRVLEDALRLLRQHYESATSKA